MSQDSADPLDEPILFFSEEDPISTRDVCEGVQIFGTIGSGKTSGSGQFLAVSYLANGFGGLVLTAKPDETNRWRELARRVGRSNDLIIFSEENKFRFNGLQYENARRGRGAGQTENLVELFCTLSTAATSNTDSRGAVNEDFWEKELKKLLRNAIEMLKLAGTEVGFRSMNRLIQSAPRSREDLSPSNVDWHNESFFSEQARACSLRKKIDDMSASEAEDWEVTFDYWVKEFCQLDERQRSSIVSSFSGMADLFLRGTLRELFSTTTNVTPEDTLSGKIIVMDLAKKDFNEVGMYAQVLFKYCWQRSVERRRVVENSRPVFLWVDESQHFLNAHDVDFLQTSRGSRVASTFLTQNLPNYLYRLGGGQKTNSLVDSLLGNLATKIFHNNTCTVTNRYASGLFERDWQQQTTTSSTILPDGNIQLGYSSTPTLKNEVEPILFTRLRSGGPLNGYLVDGIVHRAGRIFNASGNNHLLVTFNQKLP